MAKIENTTVYPLVTPNASDFVIGTDTSNDNRTVSFSISDITASGGLQNLQSVLDTPSTNIGGTAAGDITLTGNITVDGYIYPTQIYAQATPGSAGQILSSTGTGIEWIAAAGAQGLQDVIAVDPNTTLGFVMDNCDIDTTGSVNMSGAAQVLALSTNTDMTLAAGCDITTQADVYLSGASSILHFGATALINDSYGSTGTGGYILTAAVAGGVKWDKLPPISIPTLEEVLNSGNDANAEAINFTGAASATFGASYPINSAAQNTWSGSNAFSAAGTGATTAGISLSGSLWDSASTGTSGQVLTSTATGVAWSDVSAVGVSSVNATTPIAAASPLAPITITPTTGAVVVRQNIYAGGPLIGCVPDGGTAGAFLEGNGNWATPTGAVSSVSVLASSVSTGLTEAIKITPTTGAVRVQSNAFGGGDAVGHVPDATGNTANFLKGDGTWAAGGSSAPSGYMNYLFCLAKGSLVASNYYTLASNDTPSSGDRTVFTTDLGASDPAAMGGSMTDKEHIAGCFLNNPAGNLCASAYPQIKACDMSFALLVDTATAGLNWTIQVWKTSQCTSGSYTLAGTALLFSVAADTISCASIAWTGIGNETLDKGGSFFITVKPSGSVAVNADFQLNTSIRWEGVA